MNDRTASLEKSVLVTLPAMPGAEGEALMKAMEYMRMNHPNEPIIPGGIEQLKGMYRSLADPAMYEAMVTQSANAVYQRLRTPAVYSEVACRMDNGFLWNDAHWKMDRSELKAQVSPCVAFIQLSPCVSFIQVMSPCVAFIRAHGEMQCGINKPKGVVVTGSVIEGEPFTHSSGCGLEPRGGEAG